MLVPYAFREVQGTAVTIRISVYPDEHAVLSEHRPTGGH